MSLIKYKEHCSKASCDTPCLDFLHTVTPEQNQRWGPVVFMHGVPCGVTASEQSPVPRSSRASDTCPGPRDGIPQLNYRYSLVNERSHEKDMDLHNTVSSLLLFFNVAFFSFIPCLTTWPFFIPQQQMWKQNHLLSCKPRNFYFCTHINLYPNNRSWIHTFIEATHKTSSLLQ